MLIAGQAELIDERINLSTKPSHLLIRKKIPQQHAQLQRTRAAHESGEKPSLVVGFEGEGDLTEALKEAGSVAADTAPHGEPVDFTELKRSEPGISAYMYESVKPFYERSWGIKLRALFNPARA